MIMPNLVEQLNSHFASNDDIVRLQKAIEGMQTTQSAHGAITVEYDKELQRRVSHKAPFLAYLENNGSVGNANSAPKTSHPTSTVSSPTRLQRCKPSYTQWKCPIWHKEG